MVWSLRSGTVPAAAVEGPVALAVEGGEDLTYNDWERRSNAVARGLAGRGDRVGLLFNGRRWADFAVAHLGVRKAGGVAVLVSPGAAAPDLLRALSHSGATGLLCPPDLVPPDLGIWTASVEEVAHEQDTGPLADVRPRPEVVYPAAPLARPRPFDPASDGLPPVDGPLVHAWAPGSLAGLFALRWAPVAPVATLATFDPDRVCASVAARGAAACGLTPALAAALLASGAPDRHDLTSVTHVLLTGSPSAGLRAGLDRALPRAAVVEIGGRRLLAGGDAAPVAVSQEGMLWHEQFTPGSFNLPCLVRRYEGRLDVAALEWALSELVRRHQPLRTTFDVVGGVPRQIVHEHRHLELAIVDLSALPPQARDGEAARLVADATRRPFDLATGPLFEPRLVRLGADDHLLVVRLHHTVFDDWSVDVYRRELSALYTSRLAGAPSPLVEPRTTFADFSRDQRARLDGDHGAAQRAWWRQELAGAPLATQLTLGGDGTRPTPGAPLRVELPDALSTALRSLAPKLRATPYMTVLAAFSMLLGRATGRDDLVISTVVAHRDRSDLEPLVGCFTKKVPLRLRLHGDLSFTELVARTRASLLRSLAHQDLSFDEAVREGLGDAAAAHGVVPQVAVVFQAEASQTVKLALPGLTISPFEVPDEARQERHFSTGPEQPEQDWGDGIYSDTFLILSLLETIDGMALVARGAFHRPAVQQLLHDFQALLARVVADPYRPVSALVAGDPDPVPDDMVEVRGFRARRSDLEAALARCPGVAEVELVVRNGALVAQVAVDGDTPPTLAELRQALWSTLPGAPWPAGAIVVDHDRVSRTPDPSASLLAAMWGEIRGRPAEPDSNYWQDFSFLQFLAEAREAGLAISDDLVVHCRTPAMLDAAMGAGRPSE